MAAIKYQQMVVTQTVVQVLSMEQAVVQGQGALTLRGQTVVHGVVIPKVVVVREVFRKVRQAVLAQTAIMVVVMAAVAVEEITVRPLVLVGLEDSLAGAGEGGQRVALVIQERAVLAGTEQSGFFHGR